eukprot:2381598-Amphidinium_carterae.1
MISAQESDRTNMTAQDKALAAQLVKDTNLLVLIVLGQNCTAAFGAVSRLVLNQVLHPMQDDHVYSFSPLVILPRRASNASHCEFTCQDKFYCVIPIVGNY